MKWGVANLTGGSKEARRKNEQETELHYLDIVRGTLF